MGKGKQFLCFFALPEGNRWRQYWLAEAIRLQEEHSGRFNDQVINSEVQAQQLPFAEALVVRAEKVAAQQQVSQQQHKWLASWRLMLAAGFIVCAIVGFSSPIAYLSSNKEPINLLYANLLLLGPVSLALALWLGLNSFGGNNKGRGVGELLAQLAERLHGKDAVAPLGPALMSFLRRQGATRWLFGAITHAGWLIIMTGAWFGLLLMLLAQDYGFYWGSTLLTGEQVAPFVVWAGKPAAWFGLPVPDTELVIATGSAPQWGAEAKFRWGTWLLWMVWAVGWLPRCILFFYTLTRLWLIRQPKPLDVGPRWTTLEKLLTGGAASAIAAQTGSTSNDAIVVMAKNNSSQTGRNAWLGYELGNNLPIQPPMANGVLVWRNIETMQQQRAAASQLTLEQQGVRRVLLVCHGRRTPEKALKRFLEQLTTISYEVGVLLVANTALSAEQQAMWRAALADYHITWVSDAAWLEEKLGDA